MQSFETLNFNGTSVVIFTDHNYALPVWGRHSNTNNTSYRLITFDYHADTHSPLAHFVACSETFAEYGPNHPAIKALLKNRHYKSNDFCFEDVLEIADVVKNDEHIQTADWFGYIDSYVVICHMSENDAQYYQETDRRNYNDATYYTKGSFNALSLGDVELIANKPFVLDFDLDFFDSPSVFSEAFTERVSTLIKKATLITIAKEPTYCSSTETWNCQKALDMLIKLIESCLISH